MNVTASTPISPFQLGLNSSHFGLIFAVPGEFRWRYEPELMFHDQSTRDSERSVTLSRKDLSAARRLLSLLLGADRRAADALVTPAPPTAATGDDRTIFVPCARAEFKNRRGRVAVFGQSMFGEPAWDMLLALYIMDMSGARQTVGDLMKLAGTPATTANRWLAYLVSHGLVRRDDHPTDARTSFVSLTDKARAKMDEYFSGTVPSQV